MDLEDYKEWYEGYKEECECNYKGYGNCWCEGYLVTLGDLKLRYTTFIGDGDAKTFACLTELKPYDEDVEITKHGCVGNVQKRMGTALGG